MMLKLHSTVLLSLVAFLISGCGDQQHEEIQSWMKEKERGMRGKIPPLPTVRPYEPLVYDVGNALDPFNSIKAKVGSDRANQSMPDANRPREPLEEYPLETLKLVGIFQDKNRLIGQVIANGRGYQIKVGNYVGQNFGRVTRIVTAKNEERIVVKELVKDADDQWVERESELLLDARGAE